MEKQEEMELDLVGLFFYLKKKVWVLVGTLLVCALIGFFVSNFLMESVYTASTRMYVLNRSNENNMVYADFQVSSQLLNDYKVLITGPNVTKKVIEKLGLDMTPNELAGKVSVTAPDDTRVLQVNVSDNDAKQAADIANCVREIAAGQIKDIMDVDAVKLVYEAEIPQQPSAPSVKKYTVLGAMAGVIFSISVLVLVYVMDDTIRTEDDVAHHLGLSVLAVIPACDQFGSKERKNNKREQKT